MECLTYSFAFVGSFLMVSSSALGEKPFARKKLTLVALPTATRRHRRHQHTQTQCQQDARSSVRVHVLVPHGGADTSRFRCSFLACSRMLVPKESCRCVLTT